MNSNMASSTGKNHNFFVATISMMWGKRFLIFIGTVTMNFWKVVLDLLVQKGRCEARS